MSGSLGGEATLASTDGGGAGSRPDASLGRGDAVGRYVVLGRLGEGAMGVVYGAYDPELDRKVALKMLRPGLGGHGSDSRTRLLREAQALARLSHPNAVAIHDVGTHGDEVWLAMEFVEGRTLGAWLEERPRTWREVLAVIRPVALGLSAAHESGLVHRDVKPENVMLGDDRRVRVMDFGLARSSGTETMDPEPEPDPDSDQERPKRRALNEVVTRLGATPGTPAYMSPEQISGRPTDGRTDQFSLCVMLWEALYRERPFDGTSPVELATKILEGDRRPAPRGIGVPRWLRRGMERGLSVDPAARWPTLEAFLEGLDRGRTRARVAKALPGIVVALTGAGVLGVHQLDEQWRIAACEATGAGIEEVWNDGVREQLREGLLATGAGHAATTADKVVPWLDSQASDWRSARTEACLDAEVREVWDADMLDRSVRCLEDRRLELGALVARLTDADAKALTKAVPAAAGLRQVQPCRHTALLSRLPAPPTEARAQVEAVRAALSEAAALRATGAYAQGLEVAQESLRRAEAIGWSPLVAAARGRVGALLEKTGKYEDAESMLESAYFEAAKAGAIEEALSAAEGLVYTVGFRLARHAEGERWLRHAEEMRAALPDPAGLRKATSLRNLALVRWETGAYEEAGTLYERTLDIQRNALGPDHPTVAVILNNLAGVRRARGAYEEAATLYERALGIMEKALGPEHPHVATALNNLALVRMETGAYDEAATLYERALGIMENALGPEHPDVAMSLHNLAGVRVETGAYEEAATLQNRALGIMENALGPEHPNVATALNNLAVLRQETGAYEEAATLHERALGIWENALGPDHPDVAMSLNNLANMRRETGAYEEAATLYERSLGIREKALGPEHPSVAYPLLGLARVALAQGRTADAVPLADRAVKVRETGDVSVADLAEARMVLARALMEAASDRTRAVALAEQARDAYRAGGDAHREALAKTEAWLAKHGGGR